MPQIPTEVTAALLGAIVGGLIAFLPAVHVLRRQERYKVYAELVAAFSEDIRVLKIRHPNHSNEYKPALVLLEERYPSQHSLVLRASLLLGSKGNKLLPAFYMLVSYDPEHQMPTFNDYRVGAAHDEELRARELSISRIRLLLQAAKVD
jgi:hypothetical protein